MTEGQHTHDELLAEINTLKAELAKTAQGENAATQEAAQAAVNAQQAAEVAVTEAAVTRSDLDALRDELKAAIADLKSTPPAPEPAQPVEGDGVPAAPADLPDPPAGEQLAEPAQDAPDEGETVEKKETKNRPPRKRKSVWWG